MKARGEPERRCIVTRESRPKAGLIRFVAGPDGEIVPDVAGRLPGRGIWVSADAAALRQAAGKGLFARAAEAPVRVPADLAERVEALLAQRLVEPIALARKAGQAVAGLEKTKAALVSGEAALLVQAADGSARERAALRPPAGRRHPCFVPFRARIGFGIRPRSCDTCRRAGGRSRGPGAGRGPAAGGHQG